MIDPSLLPRFDIGHLHQPGGYVPLCIFSASRRFSLTKGKAIHFMPEKMSEP
jgi:hypothetical protein